MTSNNQFKNNIISKDANLITNNVEMIRLNNISIARKLEGKQKKTNKENKRKNEGINDELEALRKKFLDTAQDPSTRKLFIKNIGNSFN